MADLTANDPPPSSRFAALTARHPLLTRLAFYGASRSLSEALLGLRGIVVASILGPEGFGGWALFRLAARYAGVASLGLYRGLEYETVRALAAGTADGEAEARRVSDAAFGYISLLFGAFAVAGLGVSFLVAHPGWSAGIRAFALGTLAEQAWACLSVNLRARGRLRRFGINELASAGMHLGFTATLAVLFGLSGAYAGFVIASILSAFMIMRELPLRPRWAPDRLRRLFRVGIPLSLVGAASLVLTSVDRLVVAGFGGARLLGLYAFGVAIASLANIVAWIVRVVVFPSLYRGAVELSHRAIRRHLQRMVLPFATLLPPLLGAAAILMGPVITLLLPTYTEALGPARIFIFTGVATGLVHLALIGVVAAEQERLMPLWAVIGVILNLGLAILALVGGLGLPGVAGAALVSQSVYAAGVLAILVRAARISRRDLFLGRVLGPALWCAGVLTALQSLTPMRSPRDAAIGLGLFLLGSAPLGPWIASVLRTRPAASAVRVS